MGFISTLVVLNDHLHEVGKDQEFGRKVERAVSSLMMKRPVWIGHHALAIETHHNSACVPVLVGRSMGFPLSVAVETNPGEEPELTLLKRLADKHGYRLARKVVPRGG